MHGHHCSCWQVLHVPMVFEASLRKLQRCFKGWEERLCEGHVDGPGFGRLGSAMNHKTMGGDSYRGVSSSYSY